MKQYRIHINPTWCFRFEGKPLPRWKIKLIEVFIGWRVTEL